MVRSRDAAWPSEARGSGRPGALGSLADTAAGRASRAVAGAGRTAHRARANRRRAPPARRPPLRVCAPRRPPLRARASTQTVVRVFSTVFAAITWEFSSVRIFCSVPNQNCWVPLARNALWVRYRRSTVYARLCMFGARQWDDFGSLFILNILKMFNFIQDFSLQSAEHFTESFLIITSVSLVGWRACAVTSNVGRP